jgi:hypothetical protein
LPDTGEKTKKPFFPQGAPPKRREDFRGMLFFITLLFLAVGGVFLSYDLVSSGRMSLSLYVLSGLVFFYVAFLLPRWFKRPNPVIFFPLWYLALMACVFILDFCYFKGGWFLTFALPVMGGVLLLLETVVILLRYVKKARFFIFGGFFVALANLSYVGEILFRVTYDLPFKLTYSILLLVFFATLGVALLVIGLVPPFRRYIERRFFV